MMGITNNNISVSIIVPVYNAEKYLKRCLDSLLKQTLKNIEIILVDDASSDKSYNILKEYQNKNMEKIQVIHLDSRRGPGGARNAGIEASRGEYIGFVDSDDDVKCSMYEILYKSALKGRYDIVDAAFYNEFAMQNMRTIGNNVLGKLSLDKKKDLMIHAGFIWSKIIKRNIIIDNNIRFRENSIYEDIDFIRLVIINSKKIYAVDKILYNYRNNSESITNAYGTMLQINAKIDCMKSLVSKFKKLDIYDIYEEELIYLIYKTYMNMIDIAIGDAKNSLQENLFLKLRQFFFEFCDESYINNKYIKDISKDQRVFADLNNFNIDKLISYIKSTL